MKKTATEITAEKAQFELEHLKLKNEEKSLDIQAAQLRIDELKNRVGASAKETFALTVLKQATDAMNRQHAHKPEPAKLITYTPNQTAAWIAGIGVVLQLGYFTYLALRHYGII